MVSPSYFGGESALLCPSSRSIRQSYTCSEGKSKSNEFIIRSFGSPLLFWLLARVFHCPPEWERGDVLHVCLPVGGRIFRWIMSECGWSRYVAVLQFRGKTKSTLQTCAAACFFIHLEFIYCYGTSNNFLIGNLNNARRSPLHIKINLLMSIRSMGLLEVIVAVVRRNRSNFYKGINGRFRTIYVWSILPSDVHYGLTRVLRFCRWGRTDSCSVWRELQRSVQKHMLFYCFNRYERKQSYVYISHVNSTNSRTIQKFTQILAKQKIFNT